MTEETKSSIISAIDCLVEVRTGEDFEVECFQSSKKLYESFKDDLVDHWGFEDS